MRAFPTMAAEKGTADAMCVPSWGGVRVCAVRRKNPTARRPGEEKERDLRFDAPGSLFREDMMRLLASVALMTLAACAAAPPDVAVAQQAAVTAPAPVLTVEPYTFTGPNGVKVEAERGTFEVPENRSDPNSR